MYIRIERIYFKDFSCPLILGTKAEKSKYFTLSLFCEDQLAYQELCKIASQSDMPTIEIYEEKIEIASCYGSLAVDYFQNGETDLAMKCNNESLKIHRQIGDLLGISKCYMHFGIFYKHNKNIEKAIYGYY
jgi:DNA polymerase III alpha subunit